MRSGINEVKWWPTIIRTIPLRSRIIGKKHVRDDSDTVHKYCQLARFNSIHSIIAGCASDPKDIQASYVSPLEYQNHDCDQVSAELRRVSRRTSQLFGQLDETHSNDQAQMAVGMLLFWPTLFFLEGGDGAQAAEYARLKGEVDALEKVAIAKKCDMTVFEEIREQEEAARKAEEAKKQEQDEPYSI